VGYILDASDNDGKKGVVAVPRATHVGQKGRDKERYETFSAFSKSASVAIPIFDPTKGISQTTYS